MIDGTLDILAEIFIESVHLVNTQCRQDILKTFDLMLKLEYQAIKMFDSSGKLPSGLLKGNLKSWGKASVCHSVDILPENSGLEYHIRGKYFSGEFSIPGTTLTRYQFAICLPESCEVEDALRLLPDSAEPSVFYAEASVEGESCLAGGTGAKYKMIGIVFVSVSFLCALVYTYFYSRMSSTEIIGKINNSGLIDIENFHLVFDRWGYLHKDVLKSHCLKKKTLPTPYPFVDRFKPTNRNQTIDILSYLSLTWVVLFLTMYHAIPVVNNGAMLVSLTIFTIVAQAGHLGIETLFFISGLVGVKKLLEKTETINNEKDQEQVKPVGKICTTAVFKMFIKRSFKLSLFILIGLGFYAWSGSWGVVSKRYCEGVAEECSKDWWKNLLLISQYFEGGCFSQVKFLAILGLGSRKIRDFLSFFLKK